MPAEVATQSVAKTAAAKAKTKAKRRYLKAKKERRKKRKVTVAAGDTAVEEKLQEHSDDDNYDANDAEGSESEQEVEQQEDVAPSKVIGRPSKGETEKRPKKRRKVETTVEDELGGEMDTVKEGVMNLDKVEGEGSPGGRKSTVEQFLERRSPTPPVALPVFPLPKRPDAPSKSTLALQGLDQALIEAELVEPRTTLPVAPEDGSKLTNGLSERMRVRLGELGISELFAVQTVVIPFLLSDPTQHSLYLPYKPPRDLCVSAPTGSGKTLAYVVPIVELLASRVVTRLRALVVLPTRDLVTQVRETFEAVGRGRGLKIGAATGQHSFTHEQSQLIANRSDKLTVACYSLQGGSSKVDILICTPGRLIDHLNGTPNFSLQHLRFLVIDEADRLLAQSFQNWLAQVLAATRPIQGNTSAALAGQTALKISCLPHPDSLAPAFLHQLRIGPKVHTALDEKKELSCQKLLFSATLTQDPAKIAALNLKNPKYFVVQGNPGEMSNKEEGVLDLVMERFSMPTTLAEHMIVCDTSQKPLILFHLVHAHGIRNALIFTKSAESTTRLVRLFEFFESIHSAASGMSVESTISMHAYSSDLPTSERKSILDKFRHGEIHMLVCSDLISRGIDISHVSHVVSYDAPVDMRKYVHRVGRTARAGRAGDAWTLVEEQEARYFKDMMKSADHLAALKRIRISEKDLAPLMSYYEGALENLKESYARSKS